MFARVFALLPLALLAAADTVNQCNTGSTFCCNSDSIVGTHQVASGGLGGLLDVVAPIVATIDSTCSLVAVVDCSQQPVCCNNVNNYGGLLSIQCDSISA